MLSVWSGVGLTGEKPSSMRTPRNQMILEQAADMARYSASVDDLETWSYFLHFHKIKASPRNIHQPVVDFLVFGQLAKSTSL